MAYSLKKKSRLAGGLNAFTKSRAQAASASVAISAE
jgi:hypothetical protein